MHLSTGECKPGPTPCGLPPRRTRTPAPLPPSCPWPHCLGLLPRTLPTWMPKGWGRARKHQEAPLCPPAPRPTAPGLPPPPPRVPGQAGPLPASAQYLVRAGEAQAVEDGQVEGSGQEGVEQLAQAHPEELEAVAVGLGGDAQHLHGRHEAGGQREADGQGGQAPAPREKVLRAALSAPRQPHPQPDAHGHEEHEREDPIVPGSKRGPRARPDGGHEGQGQVQGPGATPPTPRAAREAGGGGGCSASSARRTPVPFGSWRPSRGPLPP